MEILAPFSYGRPFLEINDTILRRYARCTNEEDVKSTETEWLRKIEEEYQVSRETGYFDDGNAWKGGNLNHQQFDLPDGEGRGNEADSDGDGSDDENELKPERPELPELSDDEEEMTEIRNKILQSRIFTNPEIRNTTQSDQKAVPPFVAHGSDALMDSDAEVDVDFDSIIQATPMTDRTSLSSKEKIRAGRKIYTTASFSLSRAQVNAPKAW